jgi:UDP-N-acetylmuramoyl-tripeptide--D-alanyl-D-alanine ligase
MKRRLRKRLEFLAECLFSAAACIWRRLMFRTTFIVITGSVGKSTATACLGSILSAHFPTNWIPGGRNGRATLSRLVLATRFRHRFTVIELGTRKPGVMRRGAWMIAPDVVVMLRVLNVHSNVFPTLDVMAAEKEQLLSRLGKRGIAVMNADDPLVMAMAARSPAQIRPFGTSPGTYVFADQVSARWPERLSFHAHCGAESVPVRTNLIGEHQLLSSLAALTAAVSCGLPLEQAAAAFKDVHSVAGRMSPMLLPNGAWIIRDDFNATYPTLLQALNFMAQAQASRRIVMMGDVLDSGLTVRPRFREFGRRVAQSADMAVFLSRDGRLAAKAAIESGMPEAAVHKFEDLKDAAQFLKSELRAGDLVLSKGWVGRHVERATLAHFGDIACWMERCKKVIPCETCPELKLVPFPPKAGA